MFCVPGLLHLDDCPGQPLLPAWHMVAGSTGLVVPLLYLLFDDLNPALAKQVHTSPETEILLKIYFCQVIRTIIHI